LTEERVREIRQTLDGLVRFDNERTQNHLVAFLPVLFPDTSAAELLRNRRGPRQVRDRLDALREHLTLADRDGGALFKRDRVKAARKALDRAESELGGEESLADAAQHQLQLLQRALFEREVERHAAVDPGTGQPTRKLYGSDLLKVDADARRLGFSPEEGRRIAVELGYELLATEARAWAPITALPGAPATLDAVAHALIEHRVMALQWMRAETISSWLVGNGADAGLVDAARQAERALRAGARESAALHSLVWTLGRTDLLLGVGTARTPAALAARLRQDPSFVGELEQLARDGVLAPWFERHGAATAAAIAQRMVARGTGPGERAVSQEIQALRWALGEPLTLGRHAVTDVAGFADLVRQDPESAREALGMVRQGQLTQWLDCIAPAQSDPIWRHALGDSQMAVLGPHAMFWYGVFRNAADRALTVRSSRGDTVHLEDPMMLRDTRQLALWWDDLKDKLRGGELLAWILSHDLPLIERWVRASYSTMSDLDVRLVEWGERDRAILTPADLVALYLEDPDRFEEQSQKGYPVDWLEVRAGEIAGERRAAWQEALTRVRAMTGRVSAGHLALGVALLAGLSVLPVDPRRPGATGPGGASGVRPSLSIEEARWWEPFEAHLQSGVALVWVLAVASANFDLVRRRAKDFDAQPTADARRRWLTEMVGVPIAGPAPAVASFQGEVRVPTLVSRPEEQAPRYAPPAPRPSRAGVSAALGAGLVGVVTIAGVGVWRSRLPTPITAPTHNGRDARVAVGVSVRRCVLTTAAPTPLGRWGDAHTGLRAATNGSEVALGWRVARARRYAPDDAAVVRVDLDGRLLGWLDPESPSRENHRGWSPRTVSRSQPVYQGEGLRTHLSEVFREEEQETVRCGNFASSWWVRRSPRGSGEPSTETEEPPEEAPAPGVVVGGGLAVNARPDELGAAFYCRSLGTRDPFVLAAHANPTPEGGLLPTISLVVTRGASLSDAKPLVELTAPQGVARATTAQHPLGSLRGTATPTGAMALEVSGRGHAISFRYGRSLYFGWLDETLTVVGAVSPYPITNASHEPTLAVRGDTALVVYADHSSPGDSHSPVVLHARRGTFGGVLGEPRRLDTAANSGGSEVVPTAAALPGGWFVVWSQRVPASGDPATYRLWGRSYRDDLAPEGEAVVLLEGGNESAAVAVQDRFVVAAMIGRGGRVPVSMVAGRCAQAR
jgi:hypothetical protein